VVAPDIKLFQVEMTSLRLIQQHSEHLDHVQLTQQSSSATGISSAPAALVLTATHPAPAAFSALGDPPNELVSEILCIIPAGEDINERVVIANMPVRTAERLQEV